MKYTGNQHIVIKGRKVLAIYPLKTVAVFREREIALMTFLFSHNECALCIERERVD